MEIEVEIESDGRWLAEVPSVQGAMAYGASRAEAVSKAEALVLRILADREEEGKRGTGYRRPAYARRDYGGTSRGHGGHGMQD